MDSTNATVPTWGNFLIPCLRVLAGGEVRGRRDTIEQSADDLGLDEAQRLVTVASGELMYVNRSGWAMTHLSKAGAIESPSRGQWRISDVGRALLEEFPNGISEKEFRGRMAGTSYDDFLNPSRVMPTVPERSVEPETLPPDEVIDNARLELEKVIQSQLLDRLQAMKPVRFEQTVLDLLIAMGYGGSLGKATRTQLSNDGGIDGIIDQDALGLSRIYVQAKRYASGHSVGRPEVQAFVGALHGAQANQGVFLTTSSYTPGAIAYAESVQLRVVLIDGPLLAQLMIKHGVGIQVKRTINLVEMDEDFFE